jgi:hypothetical protein
MKRDDVEALAVAAYTAVTGRTLGDYLNEYPDTLSPDVA